MFLGLTGPIGAGKSTALIRVAATLKARGHGLGGVISERMCRDGERSGYRLLNLTRNDTQILATLDTPADRDDYEAFFCFHFSKSALRNGNRAIREGITRDVLIIDEIGLWELSGGGWGESLPLVAQRKGPVVLGLREGVAPELERMHGIAFDHIAHAGQGRDPSHELLCLLSRYPAS